MPFLLKLKFNEEMHRLLLDGDKLNFEVISQAIKSVYPGQSFHAKYVDAENDMCTLCPSTFSDFLAHCREQNEKTTMKVELFVVAAGSPTIALDHSDLAEATTSPSTSVTDSFCAEEAAVEPISQEPLKLGMRKVETKTDKLRTHMGDAETEALPSTSVANGFPAEDVAGQCPTQEQKSWVTETAASEATIPPFTDSFTAEVVVSEPSSEDPLQPDMRSTETEVESAPSTGPVDGFYKEVAAGVHPVQRLMKLGVHFFKGLRSHGSVRGDRHCALMARLGVLEFTAAQLQHNGQLDATSFAALLVSSLSDMLLFVSMHQMKIDWMLRDHRSDMHLVLEALKPLVAGTRALEQCEKVIVDLLADSMTPSQALLHFLCALDLLPFESQVAFLQTMYSHQETRVQAVLMNVQEKHPWMPKHLPSHNRITCDGCNKGPIQGLRFKCKSCRDFDLCAECFIDKGSCHGGDRATHEFEILPSSALCRGKGKGKSKGKENTVAHLRRHRWERLCAQQKGKGKGKGNWSSAAVDTPFAERDESKQKLELRCPVVRGSRQDPVLEHDASPDKLVTVESVVGPLGAVQGDDIVEMADVQKEQEAPTGKSTVRYTRKC
jgi:hypothetical protein